MTKINHKIRSDERRLKQRISFRGYCQVVTSDQMFAAHLLNISEGGALIAVVEDHVLVEEENVTIQIELPSGDCCILHGEIVHLKEHLIGVQCTPNSPLDSKHFSTLLGLAELSGTFTL